MNDLSLNNDELNDVDRRIALYECKFPFKPITTPPHIRDMMNRFKDRQEKRAMGYNPFSLSDSDSDIDKPSTPRTSFLGEKDQLINQITINESSSSTDQTNKNFLENHSNNSSSLSSTLIQKASLTHENTRISLRNQTRKSYIELDKKIDDSLFEKQKSKIEFNKKSLRLDKMEINENKVANKDLSDENSFTLRDTYSKKRNASNRKGSASKRQKLFSPIRFKSPNQITKSAKSSSKNIDKSSPLYLSKLETQKTKRAYTPKFLKDESVYQRNLSPIAKARYDAESELLALIMSRNSPQSKTSPSSDILASENIITSVKRRNSIRRSIFKKKSFGNISTPQKFVDEEEPADLDLRALKTKVRLGSDQDLCTFSASPLIKEPLLQFNFNQNQIKSSENSANGSVSLSRKSLRKQSTTITIKNDLKEDHFYDEQSDKSQNNPLLHDGITPLKKQATSQSFVNSNLSSTPFFKSQALTNQSSVIEEDFSISSSPVFESKLDSIIPFIEDIENNSQHDFCITPTKPLESPRSKKLKINEYKSIDKLTSCVNDSKVMMEKVENTNLTQNEPYEINTKSRDISPVRKIRKSSRIKKITDYSKPQALRLRMSKVLKTPLALVEKKSSQENELDLHLMNELPKFPNFEETTNPKNTFNETISDTNVNFGNPQMTSTQYNESFISRSSTRNSIDHFQFGRKPKRVSKSQFREISKSKPLIIFSGFSNSVIIELQTLLKNCSIPKSSFKLLNSKRVKELSAKSMSTGCTHVVVPHGKMKRTINFLLGLMEGAKIVDENWIRNSVNHGSWLDPSEFLISFLPSKECLSKLFSSCGCIFVSDWTDENSPAKSELISLIKLGGGNVTSSSRAALIQIGGVRRSSLTLKYSCTRVNFQWVINSIMKGTLEPLANYKIQSIAPD